MKQEARHIAETAAVLSAGNAVVWTAQDLSLVVSIILGLVSISWVVVQLIKFLLTWIRQEHSRNLKHTKFFEENSDEKKGP